MEICESHSGDASLLDILGGLRRNGTTLRRMKKEIPLDAGFLDDMRLDIVLARIDRFSDAIPDAPAPTPRLRRRAGPYRR